MSLFSLPPAFILILGAFLVPLIPSRFRNWFVILLPALAFYAVTQLQVGTVWITPFLDFKVSLLRVDKLSKAFAYIFTLSAFAAFIYAYYEKKSIQFVSALVYIGCALGVVFAGDLFSLYLFWEGMAVASTFLILARRTKASLAAAKRYILVHIFGGLVLLSGIILTVAETRSLAFIGFSEITVGTILILIGFLVNAAAFPFSSWLPDAYPEATVMGGVILSAYTSKTAVYTLIRGFPGWDILIWVGCIMAIYGLIYSLLENDIRRILAYNIVGQVGFMVCAVGIGTPLALSGAVAHAFCHIIYKSLLWMTAGAVLFRTGVSKCTELGGLYRSMPWTLVFGIVGALAISAPFTIGYISKSVIIAATEHMHLFWPWIVLQIASVVVFLSAGLKFIYFIFFNEDRGLKPKEAPFSMLFAMAGLSVLSIFLGCFPAVLYKILPATDVVLAAKPSTFYDLYVKYFPYMVPKLQMLAFSALAFFLFLPLLKRTNTLTLDVDIVYRKGAKLFYIVMDKCLNGLNAFADKAIVQGLIVGRIRPFARKAPAVVSCWAMTPYWSLSGKDVKKEREALEKMFEVSNFPIGLSALFILILFVFLIFQ